MKITHTATLVVTTFVAAALLSSCGMTDLDFAEVTSVTPVNKTVSVPREECRDELVTRTRETKDPNQITGTVTGAIIGGVLGNQVGGGSGKDVATVAGAVAGGYAGNKTQEGMQARNTYEQSERRCTTINESHEEQAGYDVEYKLNGATHMIHLAYDPGDRIPLVNGKLSIKQ